MFKVNHRSRNSMLSAMVMFCLMVFSLSAVALLFASCTETPDTIIGISRSEGLYGDTVAIQFYQLSDSVMSNYRVEIGSVELDQIDSVTSTEINITIPDSLPLDVSSEVRVFHDDTQMSGVKIYFTAREIINIDPWVGDETKFLFKATNPELVLLSSSLTIQIQYPQNIVNVGIPTVLETALTCIGNYTGCKPRVVPFAINGVLTISISSTTGVIQVGENFLEVPLIHRLNNQHPTVTVQSFYSGDVTIDLQDFEVTMLEPYPNRFELEINLLDDPSYEEGTIKEVVTAFGGNEEGLVVFAVTRDEVTGFHLIIVNGQPVAIPIISPVLEIFGRRFKNGGFEENNIQIAWLVDRDLFYSDLPA